MLLVNEGLRPVNKRLMHFKLRRRLLSLNLQNEVEKEYPHTNCVNEHCPGRGCGNSVLLD